MPRVFLLTNCDDADVESVANNDDEEVGVSNDDDTNSSEDGDNLLNFFFVLASKKFSDVQTKFKTLPPVE